MPKLVKFIHDWADEHDVYGLEIMEDEMWEKYLVAIHNLKYPAEFSFGTNEDLVFENAKDALNSCTVYDIGQVEENILKKYISNSKTQNPSAKFHYFGYFPTFLDHFDNQQREVFEKLEKIDKSKNKIEVKYKDEWREITGCYEENYQCFVILDGTETLNIQLVPLNELKANGNPV